MAGYKKKKKQGFVARMVMGAEKSEGFARASLPSNRWELFWDIFKGRIGKLILINLLMCLFFLPTILLFVFRYVYIANLGMEYPYAQGFGVGYQALTSMVGLSESAIYSANLTTFLFMPLVLAIAAVGLSGGAYVMRNMVWTEGVFVANDFWTGIRKNYKNVLLVCLIFSVLFYLTVLAVSLLNSFLATAQNLTVLLWIAKILIIAVMVFYTIMSLHMITMTVTYEVKFGRLFLNSFYTTFALFIPSVIFIALGLVPFVFLLLGDFFRTLGILVALLIGFSVFMLVWTDFCQWVYDRYINDRVEGAIKNRGIYEKVKKDESEMERNLRKHKEQMEYAALSSLSSKPIKPITDEELTLAELPQSFNRSDIEKLNQSRKELYDDNEKYIKEHSSDARYTDLQKTQEQLDKEENERLKRIEQAKKELAKRKKKK